MFLLALDECISVSVCARDAAHAFRGIQRVRCENIAIALMGCRVADTERSAAH